MKLKKLFKLTFMICYILFPNFCIADSVEKSHLLSKKLEGYKVEFSYDSYPEEREIVYKYLQKQYNKIFNQNSDSIQKNSIGIDLYDINDDGEKEILFYLIDSGSCGSAGCHFDILQKINGNFLTVGWPTSYTPINVHTDIIILHSTTNHYHDIAFKNENYWSIWCWTKPQGYNFYKKHIIN